MAAAAQQQAAEALLAGRPEEAARLYRVALARAPDDPQANLGLGIALRQGGTGTDAEAVLRRTVALAPAWATAHKELGLTLWRLGRPAEAATALREAIRLGLSETVVHTALGRAQAQLGRHGEAVAAFRAAARSAPGDADVLANLGAALLAQGHYREAAAASAKALRIRPAQANALANFGYALAGLDRHEDAAAACAAALELEPGHVNARGNLGLALLGLARYEEALAALDHALALAPDRAEIREVRAMALLLLGRFDEGWAEYEHRRSARLPLGARHAGAARWRGEPLRGRTILLHAEQGLGDTIMFARYVPEVAQRGGPILLLVPPALRRLFRDLPGTARLLTSVEALPAFDLHCPLPSLPAVCGARPDAVPAARPYLRAESDAVARWRQRLGRLPGPLRAGLVWAGNPAHRNDGNRSIPFETLAPLLDVAGVGWASLQVGPRAADLARLPTGRRVEDLAPALDDLAEAAAAIAALDLVVTVDTAVAHLAGALGRPVWVMLPHVPDWRWLLERADSPWYPTARLFRQARAKEWDGVVARVATALSTHAGAG